MAFKLDQSNIILSEETQIFDIPDTVGGILRCYYATYRHIGAMSSDGPFEFHIPGTGADYLWLYESRLHVVGKILKEDGTDITDTENCGPINNFLGSLVRQMDVQIQDRLTSTPDVSNIYAIITKYKRILFHGDELRDEEFPSSGLQLLQRRQRKQIIRNSFVLKRHGWGDGRHESLYRQ